MPSTPSPSTPAHSTSGSTGERPVPEYVDVLVVGAGISGIDAGYRLQTMRPHDSYEIVEARAELGGTWDLFRYPGIRCDSDMWTLSFPFAPWPHEQTIAEAPQIKQYLVDVAKQTGVYDKITFGTRVTSASWSSDSQLWTVHVSTRDADGTTGERVVETSFLFLGTGYYEYAHGYRPDFPGADDFAGVIADPQLWPEDLDYTGKRVVVIGSGATAVTIVPAMAKSAAHVTMLQRSPTYMMPLPTVDPVATKLRAKLPRRLADQLVRKRAIAMNSQFYALCKASPGLVKKMLRKLYVSALGDEKLVDEHFTPSYDPWDQRVCVIPDSDLFTAISDGSASVVTDHIDRFVPEGVRLASGAVLEADVIVPATGLALSALGGIELEVDGHRIDPADCWIFQSCLLSGVPNAAWCIGYATSSWTLRADLTAKYVARLRDHMEHNGYGAVVPIAEPGMDAKPLLSLTSGYVRRSADRMPKQSRSAPWQLSQNYLRDRLRVRDGFHHRDLLFSVRTANNLRHERAGAAASIGGSDAAS